MSTFNLAELLDLSDLNKYLSQVNQQMQTAAKVNNSYLYEPALRLINVGGKRLRPSLLMACGSINGAKVNDQFIQLAAAIELIHVGSLVHDDIIDEAATRWNVATINTVEGVNQAIIIGDYLLACANVQAAQVGSMEATIIAQTIIELCDGQSREIAEKYNLHRSQTSMLKAIGGKTAALLAASCQLGGLLAGLKESEVKSLELYGYNFGIAFQLIDDLLDILSTPQLSGKPVGSDTAEGVYTLPVLLGLKSPQAEALKTLLASQAKTTELANLLLDTTAISQTLDVIGRHNMLAKTALDGFKTDVSRALAELPELYLSWAIHNLVAEDYRSSLLQMQKVNSRRTK